VLRPDDRTHEGDEEEGEKRTLGGIAGCWVIRPAECCERELTAPRSPCARVWEALFVIRHNNQVTPSQHGGLAASCAPRTRRGPEADGRTCSGPYGGVARSVRADGTSMTVAASVPARVGVPVCITARPELGPHRELELRRDTANCHMFFMNNKGQLFQADTALANVPNGFGRPPPSTPASSICTSPAALTDPPVMGLPYRSATCPPTGTRALPGACQVRVRAGTMSPRQPTITESRRRHAVSPPSPPCS
jgi:hypothetical protein